MSERLEGSKRLMENALSFWQLLFYAVVSMGPAGAFVVGGSTALDFAGPAAPLSFLIAGGLLYLAIIAVYIFTTKVANAGGYYKFVEVATNNVYLSKTVGLLQALYQLSVLWFASVLSGWLFWTTMETLFSISVPLYIVLILTALGPVLYMIIGYRNISLSGNIAIALSLLQIVIYGAIAALLIAKSPYNGPVYFNVKDSWGGLGGFFAAVVVGGFLSYSGYGSVIMYGEEARTPHRTLKLAIAISALIIILFETFEEYSIAAAAGPTLRQGLQFFSPGFYYTKQYLGDAWLVLAAGFFLVLQVLLNIFYGNTFARVVYALARDKVLPQGLYDVHPKYRSPHKAVLATGVVGLVGSLALVLAFVHFYGIDEGLFYAWVLPATIITIAWGIYHIVVNQSLPFMMRRLGRLNVLYHVVAPTASSITIAVAIYYAEQGLGWPLSIAYYIIPAWIAASLIYVASIRGRVRMDSLATVGGTPEPTGAPQ